MHKVLSYRKTVSIIRQLKEDKYGVYKTIMNGFVKSGCSAAFTNTGQKKQKESSSSIRINCTDVCRVQLIVIKIRD